MNLLMNYLLHGWRWTGQVFVHEGIAYTSIEHRNPARKVVPVGVAVRW